MAEVTHLIAAVAALMGGITGLLVYFNKRQKDSRNEWLSGVIEDKLLEAANFAGPGKTQGIDIAFGEPAVALRIPVILDEWVPLPWGLSVCGVDFGTHSSRYLLKCTNTSRLLTHKHAGVEEVFVIQGEMVDLDTGTRYKPGQTWTIPAETPHAVHFDAPPLPHESFMAMVTVKPRLPYTSEVPLDLKGLPRLLQRAR